MKKFAVFLLISLFSLFTLGAQQNTLLPFPGESQDTFRQRALAMDNLRSPGFFPSPIVERAFRSVPRDLFLPKNMQPLAYRDIPVPTFGGATIPSFTTLALVVRNLQIDNSSKILILGDGTGYAGAILSRLGGQVFILEGTEENYAQARTINERGGYTNIRLLYGRDSRLFASEAPFDCILIHGALTEVPSSLTDLLGEGGRMVVSLRDPQGLQMLLLLEREGSALSLRSLGTALFSPLNP